MSDDEDGPGGDVVPFPGADGPKCGADRSSRGLPPCGNRAGQGTSHEGRGPCKFHYGNTKQSNIKYAREEARELALKYGQPINTDPGTALLQEVQRTAGIVAYFTEQLEKFTIDVSGEPSPVHQGWLNVYMAERGHLAKTAKMALDAGVQHRAVEFAQQQGEQLASAIREILDGLALTPAQREIVPDIVPRVLRELMSAGEAS